MQICKLEAYETQTRIVRLYEIQTRTVRHRARPIFARGRGQGTAFTYQGQLQFNGVPFNGPICLFFALYGESSGGGPVLGGGPIAPVGGPSVGVTNGLFTVLLDFGSTP